MLFQSTDRAKFSNGHTKESALSMAIKKTELYSSLWASCDELRGGMDASQYKDYVLTLLFMKYVSDKYSGDPHGMIVVPVGGSFKDMVALKGDKEIGDKINKIIGALAEENSLKGVIDVADLPRYSRKVPLKDIQDNGYNLNIPRYIDSSDPEDLHDLSAHLNGGIPNVDIDALGDYWRVFPQLRSTMVAPSDRSGYSNSLVEASQVKVTILNHPEFTTFAERSLKFYTDWCKHHEAGLKRIAIGDKPKALIELLSEDLLARFSQADLLDKIRYLSIVDGLLG
jgi:hypothetical protein